MDIPETTSAQAEAITDAVEKALEAQAAATPAVTAAQKLVTAQGIYLAWRNANLAGLPVESFHQVEAASGDLISAIAAAL
jgi:hypothetical protein